MRPPSVFVRPLSLVEAQRLKRLSKQAKHSSTRQRAGILLASATEMSAPEIARMWMTDESHVRKVIHDFNLHGFASLRPRFRGGRPRRISTEDEPRPRLRAEGRPRARPLPRAARGWGGDQLRRDGGRSASAPTTGVAGRGVVDLSATAPPTAAARAFATWSAPSTSTPATCGRG